MDVLGLKMVLSTPNFVMLNLKARGFPHVAKISFYLIFSLENCLVYHSFLAR